MASIRLIEDNFILHRYVRNLYRLHNEGPWVELTAWALPPGPSTRTDVFSRGPRPPRCRLLKLFSVHWTSGILSADRQGTDPLLVLKSQVVLGGFSARTRR